MYSNNNTYRIVKNTIFLYVRMLFVLFVSLYISRVVLNTLGIEDYGIYNVVAGFVSLFGFLNATLSSSMQRFYNYEGSKNENGYFYVYTTGFIIHLVLAVIVFIVLETIGLWYINCVMVIPIDKLFSANIVYQASVLSMLLVIFQIPYIGVIMATEKMNYYALISVMDIMLKFTAIVMLPYFSYNKLIIYSIIIFFINLFDFGAYYIYARRKILTKSFKWNIDKSLLKSIMSFSGWNLIGTFSFLLKGQGVNMTLNYFFGPIINAARGIAFQINGAINGFSANIAISFRPQIVNSYAQGDFEKTKYMMYLESKICFTLMLAIMVPVIIEIDYLLKLWLGNLIPNKTNAFAILVLVDSLICTLNTPCSQVAFATGDLKKFQISNSIVNFMLIPVSLIVLYFGASAIGVFFATIIFSILNQMVCLFYLNKIFPINFNDYVYEIVIPCVMMVFIVPILAIIVHFVFQESFVRLMLVFISNVVMAVIVFFFLILKRSERISIADFIKLKLK